VVNSNFIVVKGDKQERIAFQNGILQHKGALPIAELIISKEEDHTLSHSAACMAPKDSALVPDSEYSELGNTGEHFL